jgi:3-(3-hydroxy-phenyl)propionate hydroxylase
MPHDGAVPLAEVVSTSLRWRVSDLGLERTIDVAIIGAGPVGALLGNLLGQHGLSTVIFERAAAIVPLPRAIHFDGEVMRVFETAGLRPEVEAISRPGLKGMVFVNAAGETLMIRGGATELGPHGCANNHYFHQPELEAVLRRGLQRFESVRLLTQHELQSAQPWPHGGARLQVRGSAQGGSQTWHARWVVGCDGARSLVRRLLGSPMLDLDLHQPWLVVDAQLKQAVDSLPSYTVQHCDPARPMTYCNVTGNRRRWEIMLLPGDDPAQMVEPDHLAALLSPWVQPHQVSIERAVIYTFHSVIAQGWRLGPLMLAGDAAHQTPPFMGQGLCAGIRDAANLAWKLAAIQEGRADESLLDSYESERAPHVKAFIDLAVNIGAIIQTTNPEAARARDARFTAGSPEIFECPAPQLGPGLWRGDTTPVGQVFPQPVLDDGRWLDAVVGQRFAVLADPALLATVGSATRAWWRWQRVVDVPAVHVSLKDWLQQHGVAAVLLRPDRYIAGIAKDAQALESLTASLPWLKPPPAATS